MDDSRAGGAARLGSFLRSGSGPIGLVLLGVLIATSYWAVAWEIIVPMVWMANDMPQQGWRHTYGEFVNALGGVWVFPFVHLLYALDLGLETTWDLMRPAFLMNAAAWGIGIPILIRNWRRLRMSGRMVVVPFGAMVAHWLVFAILRTFEADAERTGAPTLRRLGWAVDIAGAPFVPIARWLGGSDGPYDGEPVAFMESLSSLVFAAVVAVMVRRWRM